MPPVGRGVPSPRGVAAETVPVLSTGAERVKAENQPGVMSGEWVALDGATCDAKRPAAGVVVDHDRDLVRLCSRLRAKARTHCRIVRW